MSGSLLTGWGENNSEWWEHHVINQRSGTLGKVQVGCSS